MQPFSLRRLSALVHYRYHFTGKERDTESGLDYLGARYYGSPMGRMLSPDPGWFISAQPANPQTWNQYAYVLNNPLSFTDPTGLDCVYLNDAGNGIEEVDADVDTSQKDCSKTGGSYVPGRLKGYTTDSNDPDNTITKLQYAPYTSNADFTGPQPSIGSQYMNVNLSTIPLKQIQLQNLIAQNNKSQLSDAAIGCIIGIEDSSNDPQSVYAQGGANNPYRGLPLPGNTAKGLMQVTNGATQDIVQNKYFTGMGAQQLQQSLFDPATNIQAGTDYIQLLIDRYGENSWMSHYGPRESNCVK